MHLRRGHWRGPGGLAPSARLALPGRHPANHQRPARHWPGGGGGAGAPATNQAGRKGAAM